MKFKPSPYSEPFERARAVCARCHYVMRDGEPMAANPDYLHPAKDRKGKRIRCPMAGRRLAPGEWTAFARKRDRRAMKRGGKMAGKMKARKAK